ncbi:hypothetical protein A8C56_01395 [Niabella ginsenosidivorans]|uniref:Uncharacterized protein n=1 Tax=Niabella ginsenosidivorans TaxID=1176587 RepID=A0A1A9HZQ8_9BACT|nr:hypothetical protein [Niabella ginsenosidivorans]ANH79804.1 hypothetical protein A8C56_01395 [Niabella ginsenosidivorans]
MNDGFLLFLLFGIPALCAVIMLVGIVMLFSKDERVRKTGTRLLLIGFIVAVVTVVIGFSICTGAFGGFH